MKFYSILIFFFATIFPANFYAQQLDSIILKNNIPKIENPKHKILASKRINFSKAISNAYDSGYPFSTNEYTAPNLYYVTNNGEQKSLNEYLKDKLKGVKDEFNAYFKVKVDWNGNIIFIKLIGYTGNIINIDFVQLLKNVKAKPATEFNIPVKTVTLFRVFNTK